MIDALENTPAAKINTKRLGVTGGSRNGKGALGIGAFEERITLTIPQESGAGGSGNWRFSEAIGSSVQRVSSTVNEQAWFAKTLEQFSNAVNKLPIDQHEILALCAPRALLLIENPDYVWLCNEGCWNNGKCVQMVYQSLGIADRMGYTSVGGHMHCTLPQSQYADVNAFVKKFLLDDKTANTNIFKSDKSYTLNTSKWLDWTAPTLSGELIPDPITGGSTVSYTPTPTVTKAPTYTPTNTPKKNKEDINNDGAINMADVMLISTAFNVTSASAAYKKDYDMNLDNAINMIDVMAIAAKFGQIVS
jgi:hypothetical protein